MIDEIKEILDFGTDLCAGDCGYETDSYACRECQATQLNNLFDQKVRKIFEEIEARSWNEVRNHRARRGITEQDWQALKDRKEGE